MSKFTVFIFSAVLAFFSGCAKNSSMDIPAVADLDIEKYMGKWYEYARLPNRFEKNMRNVYAEYTMRRDGKTDVVNCGFDGKKTRCISGIAKSANQAAAGELKVSFFRPFYGKYRIIYLDEKYTKALVTSSTFDYLWILSRERKLPEKELNMLVMLAAEYGFDTESLIFPQK